MPSSQVKADTIDGVILRLLGLKPGQELDYDIYFDRIKKLLVRANVANKSFAPEETELLRSELKRAQKLKGKRFKVKEGKARVSSTPKGAPKKKIETQKLLPPKGAIIKAPSNKLAPKDINRVEPVKVRDVTPKNPIDALRVPLDSIFAILQSKFKFEQKQTENKRKEEENKKRGKRESSLEGFKKGISEIVSATKKLLAPFEDVINRIKRFIFFTLLGRAFTGFLDWMKDKGNQEKFNSFVEFLSKHWPALAGLYVLFGTSLGKLARGIVKLAARMIVALAVNIPKIFSFIRKNKKLSLVGFALGSYASGRVAEMLNSKEPAEATSLAKPTDDLSGVKQDVDRTKAAPVPKLNQFNLGGLVPKFAAGGINPFGGMDFAAGVPIQGAGKDDTLIAAKTGEAILTEKDQKDISQRYVDRETGQPLNIPQYLAGRKPGQVAFSKLRFPTLSGGFFGGGMINQFNQGGVVGKSKLQPPKISPADFHSLLAISALEDDKPQGRADVAQSLYNRLLAANKYKTNFNQVGNTLKDLIIAKDQYQPTFTNRNDWLNISDRNSAALAIMNSKKGKEHKWTLKDAMAQLTATEAALRNPKLQYQAQRHVGGRAFFLGTSQHENMKPEKGDVVRSNKSNFFTAWHLEGTQYDKERRNLAAPIPKILLPKAAPPKPKKTNVFDKIRNVGTNILNFFTKPSANKKQAGGPVLEVKENDGYNIPGATADRQLTALQPGEYVLPRKTVNTLGLSLVEEIVRKTDSNSAAYLRRGTVRTPQITPYMSRSSAPAVMELPPIMASSAGAIRPRASGLGGGSQVPSFSAVAPDNERDKNAAIYGLVG